MRAKWEDKDNRLSGSKKADDEREPIEATGSFAYDVAIIGAGIVGLSLARELMRYQLRVLLLEQGSDVATGATKANSAIVHGGYAESADTLKGRLCYQGRKRFAELDAELDFGFDACGSLVVAFEGSDINELERLRENGLANGIPYDELEIWDQDKLRSMVPGITDKAVAALFCEGAGICSPYGMAIALAENAVQNGLTLKLSEAFSEVELIEDCGFMIRSSRGNRYMARRIVNAAGLGGQTVAEACGISGIELFGRSGEYILLDRGSDEQLPYVLFGMPTPMGKGILLSKTIHGNLILGPDATELRELSAIRSSLEGRDTHLERLLNIWQQAEELFPNLPAAKIIRSFAGVRAAEVRGDFVIGRDPDGVVANYYQALGIQSPGITAAPAIADLLIGLMEEDGLLLVQNEEFIPERQNYMQSLASASLSPGLRKRVRVPLEAAELEARLKLESGTEGRMVCRCEQVPESVILAALEQGISLKTVDAVKRRTRAGMGRCQGMFCRSRVAGILAKDQGIPLEAFDADTDVEHLETSRVSPAILKQAIRKLNE